MKEVVSVTRSFQPTELTEKVTIRIKNWSKHQSYKDRRPPWIRFHRDILDDYKFQSMSAEARAILPMLWLLACEFEDPKAGIINASVHEIGFRLRQSPENIAAVLNELQLFDFIECIETVTKPYLVSNQTVTPETETETETETDIRENSQANSHQSRPPYQKILELYHQKLPSNPKIEKLDDTRRNYIRQLWHGELSELEYWENFFDFVSGSSFLTGKTEPRDGKKPFRPNLEWLTKPKNFLKIKEELYHG